MTICLGLICDDGKSVVAVADRMVSDSSLSLEFEQETCKIDLVGKSFAAMTAGDALAHTDLIRDVASEISNLPRPTVRDVAGQVRRCFARHRQELAEALVLQRAGLDYATFLDKQQSLSESFVVGLYSEFQAIELGVEVLLAGVDPSGAHLYTVGDPGIVNCFDSIGYAVVGSGEPHAEGFLTEADYSPRISLRRGILLAYFAKRHGERAPGVGSRFTDILTIEADKGARFLTQGNVKELATAYPGYLTQLRHAFEQAEESVSNMSLDYATAEGGDSDGQGPAG